ncbi:MAG: M48 family metallopeptidase [Lachnoclostridium sp.]|nr:M48 family metallopeptidase [Lachnospira sp.]MCM1249087.1 M48 family metallopeptidase [Lachnoclostridium sp.]
MVSANTRVPTAFIDEFVQKNQEYIFQVLEKFRERQQMHPMTPKQYVSGEDFMILGRHLTLQVQEIAAGNAAESGERVCAEGSALFLFVKDKDDFKRKEKLMNKWLQSLQREVFDRICQEIYPAFEEYGIAYPQIKIRRMTSRWGSCQPVRGIITLNSRLIEAPRESIEYVVLHEFAHFIHPNHSKDFYAFVAKLMPDWKERKAVLNS